MMCWPPSGYEKIGYQEDIHFIKLSDANDIPDLVEDVEKNIIKFAKIASRPDRASPRTFIQFRLERSKSACALPQ